jgi:autotransporter-associated beta strand protein
MLRVRIAFAALACVAVAAVPPRAARGQSWTWDGGGSSGNWNTANNWNPNTVPIGSAGTSLTFGGGTLFIATDNNIPGTFGLTTLTFASSATFPYSISGNTLSFADSGPNQAKIVQNSGFQSTISTAITLNDDLSVQGSGTGALLLNGAIAGTGGLTKNGPFALTLGASNTFIGATVINAGTVRLGDSYALRNSAVTINVNGGLDLNGLGLVQLGSLAGSGSLALGSTSFYTGGNNASTTYSGTLSGGSSMFYKDGTGTLSLTGGGTLFVAEVRSGTLDFSGGTWTVSPLLRATSTTSVGKVRVRNGASVTSATGFFDISGAAGTSLDVSGGGMLSLRDLYLGDTGGTGTVTVDAGTLTIGSSFQIHSGSATVRNGGVITGNPFSYVTAIGGSLTVADGGQLNVGVLRVAEFGQPGSATVDGGTVTVGQIWLSGSGGGTANLTIRNGGSVVAGNTDFYSPDTSLTVDRGTLTTKLNGAAGSISLTDPAGGTALTLTAGSGSNTFSGVISGTGGLTKSGGYTQVLTGGNTYTGRTVVTEGVLEIDGLSRSLDISTSGTGQIDFVGADVQSFSGRITAGAGTRITYSGGTTVSGGFLRGTGSHEIGNGGATFSGTTLVAGARLSATSETNLVDFTNAGTVDVAAGQTVPWDGLGNSSSGRLILGGTLNASYFSSDGRIDIAPGATLKVSGTNLTLGGGSRTYVGTAAAPGGTINLDPGLAVDVNGGLLVNNGTINGPVNINYGGLAKGAGNYAGGYTVNDGGRFQPGNSPGTVRSGSAVWGAGGAFAFDIANATGVAGTDWSLNQITGGLAIDAGTTAPSRFTLSVDSLGSDLSPGALANWDPAVSRSWTLVTTTTGITGFDPAEFTIDLTGFTAFNSLGTGSFSLAVVGNDLVLNFTAVPVPEPAAATAVAALAAAGALGARAARRRARRR